MAYRVTIGPESPWDTSVKHVTLGPTMPLGLIAGPCQLESLDHALFLAARMAGTCAAIGMPFVFKASYDKANRTASGGRRGLGIVEGLRVLEEVRKQIGVPTTTDVHDAADVQTVAGVVDLVQIPAMLSRQTDLLTAAGTHARAVNVKKGQGAAPGDMVHAVDKLVLGGLKSTPLLTERGTSFGYGRLVNDMRGLSIMAGAGVVVFDATHSVQLPAGIGHASGGERWHVPALARAAVATGFLGAVFLEVHDNPDSAPSDGPCMLHLEDLGELLITLSHIDSVVKRAHL